MDTSTAQQRSARATPTVSRTDHHNITKVAPDCYAVRPEPLYIEHSVVWLISHPEEAVATLTILSLQIHITLT
jgi:hypothetical protein